MKSPRLDVVVLGLSLSSAWGNGHATTYRSLLRAFAERGHSVLFLERAVPWYAEHRDLVRPDYCRLVFYRDLRELERFRRQIAAADAVIVGSYVPDGAAVGELVLTTAQGVKAFYDIDTPVTLAALEEDRCEYITPGQIPRYDVYLSFTGGGVLDRLENVFKSPSARALCCSVDADIYRPQPRARRRWDLGYLGTYSADRQPMLEKLLIEPAQRAPDLNFIVAGAQYPSTVAWPSNVELVSHLPPSRHAQFYSSLAWTLNITRRDMVRAGHSPSVRLFEAAACACPVISDDWAGLDTFFTPGQEIVIAGTPEAVLAAMQKEETARQWIGAAARQRVLQAHTARHRARELESFLLGAKAHTPLPAE